MNSTNLNCPKYGQRERNIDKINYLKMNKF